MLTDAKCRSAKGRERPYKLADAHGLHLFVTPTGFRSWRWKYRLGGKEKRIVFGSYPDMSLAQARLAREDAARQLRDGTDPAEQRKRAQTETQAADTFEAIGREWHQAQSTRWASRHAENVIDSFTRDVFPAIGAMPVGSITPPQVLDLLRAIEARGAIETAHRVRQRISAVFVYAIALGRAEADPAAIVQAALAPLVHGRQPAFRTIEQAREVLRLTEQDPGQPSTKLASRLLALTAVRPGVLRMAQIEEFEQLDGPEPVWHIPATKMKLSTARKLDETFDFIVPLAPQAIETVRLAAEVAGRSPWLFPNLRHVHRPMSENAIGYMYNRTGSLRGRHVPHGWRTTFSTVMNELAEREDRPGDRAVIDLMLAHIPTGVESRYNRAAYLPRRREIALLWADLLMQGMAAPDTLLELPRH